MCDCCKPKTQGCQKPAELKSKPAECSPKQVRQCHGAVKEHSCTKPAKT